MNSRSASFHNHSAIREREEGGGGGREGGRAIIMAAEHDNSGTGAPTGAKNLLR